MDAIFERLEREPPEAVLISGAAGIGKSRLLREVGATAAARGWSIRSVVGTSSAAAIPFSAMVSLLTDISADSSSEAMLAHAKRSLSAAGGDPPQLLGELIRRPVARG